MGRGFLTGRIKRVEDLASDDFRRNVPRFQGESFAQNLKLVERVGEIASRKGVTTGQLVLAWLLAQGKEVVPIPGTTRRKHLEENNAALDIELTESDLSELASAMPPGAVIGMRQPEAMMRLSNL